MYNWTEIDPLLGTVPDADLARRFGVGESAVNRRRRALGIAPYRPPLRSCLVCGEPAFTRAGFCHTHHERWRRWDKPDPAEWAAAFRAGRLNTCAVCGGQWNGYHGCRHCSPECLAVWKREAALARYHALSPEQKRAAVERSLAASRRRRRAGWVTIRCTVCGAEFEGPPSRTTCGLPACRSQNITRHSRAFRARLATVAVAEVATKLQRR